MERDAESLFLESFWIVKFENYLKICHLYN